MTKKIGGYRDEAKLVATATTHTLDLYIEEPSDRVLVEYVACKNVDASGDLCAIGIESGGAFYPLQTQVMTTADYWYGFRVHAYVFPGEIIRFDFSGITITNTIKCLAVGHHEYD